MKTTKRELRRLIREMLIYEAEFYDETPAGQLTGTAAEDARFTQQLEAEKLMKAAGLTKPEIAELQPVIKSGEFVDELEDSPAVEKLLQYFQNDIPQGMSFPQDWVLDRLQYGPPSAAEAAA